MNVDNEVIEEFKKEVNGYISDIYTEIASVHKNNEPIAAFSKIFGLHGQKVEEEVLNPIYKVINETIDKLEGLKISETNTINAAQKETIKSLISARGTLARSWNSFI